MADRLALFIKSRPFPRRSEAPVAGLTRTVLNWGSIGGLGSGLFVLSAGGSATTSGSVLSLDSDPISDGCASCPTFAGQRNFDLGGMAPVF